MSKVAKVEQLPKPGLRKGCRGRARGRERWSATWEIKLVDSYGKTLGDINRWWLFVKRYQQKYKYQTACFANISKFDKEALKLMKLFLLDGTGG